jgi:predicted nucleotidyltransferase
MDRERTEIEGLIEEVRAFMRRVGVGEAIFYGSRAYGAERPHSDLNLVLLSEAFAGRPLAKMLQDLQAQWKLDVYVEMLPVSPEEFEEMKSWNSLAQEADECGVRVSVRTEENEQ